MRKLMFSKLLSGVLVIAGFALFIFVGKHVFATPKATGGADNQTKDRASKRAVSLENGAVLVLEGEPEDPAFWDMGGPSAKIVAGANANAVLSLDLVASGEAGNQRDDGVTTGTVSGQGTTIAIEVFATGVRTSLIGFTIEFDLDPSFVALVRAEDSIIPQLGPINNNSEVIFGSMTARSLSPSGFLARAEFETIADVTGREFAIGIARVMLGGSDFVVDSLTTTSVITFNATPSPDFDGDGTVGFSDFVAFASNYGTQRGDAAFDARFDLDGDGETGFSDFIAFVSQYGTTVGSAPPSGSPDLIVESLSVNDNTLTTGLSFTLGATVRNQGNASAAATTLRYYRSSNATISSDDVEVGTDAVSSLSAGGTSAESISLNAPSSAGTYYYGACVENVSGESITGNNCSDGVSITVATETAPGGRDATKMYWTEWDTESIRRSDLDGSGIENLVTSGLDAPGGIALDVAGGKMYWTDWDKDKIQRSNLDGSDVEDLITGLTSPYAIALDVAGGKMYWTDGIADKIQRSNLDGSGVEDLITGLDAPGGIALDVADGKMYWSDGGDKDKIQRSNLDGSGVEDLVNSGLDEPEGIALDVAGGKMYWSDGGDKDKIQRSNLDGSGVEDLVTTGFWEPRSIALDVAGGKMYWTHSRAKIQRSNLDGSHVEDLITGLGWPLGIALGSAHVEAGKGSVVPTSATITP